MAKSARVSWGGFRVLRVGSYSPYGVSHLVAREELPSGGSQQALGSVEELGELLVPEGLLLLFLLRLVRVEPDLEIGFKAGSIKKSILKKKNRERECGT